MKQAIANYLKPQIIIYTLSQVGEVQKMLANPDIHQKTGSEAPSL
jgi:hypothetical protein